MAGNISSTAIDISLRLRDEDYLRRVHSNIAAQEKLFRSWSEVGSVIPQVNRRVRDSESAYQQIDQVLLNTGLRINDMTRAMGGLFAAQQRLAQSRRELQDVFSQNLNTQIQGILTPDADDRSVARLTERLNEQRLIAGRIRVEHEGAQKVLERETAALDRQRVLQAELRSLKSDAENLAKDTDGRALNANLARQKEIQAEVAKIGNATERQTAAQQRVNTLATQYRDVVREATQTAGGLAKATEAAAKQEQADLQRTIKFAQDRDRRRREDDAAYERSQQQQAAAAVAAQDAERERLIRWAQERDKRRRQDNAAYESYQQQQAAAAAAAQDAERERLIRWAQERDRRRRDDNAAHERYTNEERQRIEDLAEASRRISESDSRRFEQQDRAVIGRTDTPDNRNAEQMQAAMERINARLQERRRILADLRAEELRIAQAGGNTADVQNRIQRELKFQENIQQDRLALQNSINRTVAQEGKARDTINELLSKLSSTDAARVQISAQVARNQEVFEKNLQDAIRLQQISVGEAERLRNTFARLNTDTNVARQLSLSGGFNRGGAAFQQLAFGVEDFASQIDRGLIPALGGAANNINQVVSLLGPPWLVGVSVAVIATIQFARAFGVFEDSAETAQQKLDRLRGGVSDYVDGLKNLREQIEIRINARFTPDLDDLVSEYETAASAIRDTNADLQQALREAQIEATQNQLDDLDNLEEKASSVVNHLLAFGGNGTALRGLVDRERRRLDLQQELKDLGGDLTEEERKRLALLKQQEQQQETLLQLEQRRTEAAQKLLADIIAGNPEIEDKRQLFEIEQDALKLARDRKFVSDELLSNQEELFALERNIALGAPGVERERQKQQLFERQLELTARIADIDAKINADRERQLNLIREEAELREKAREDLNEAQKMVTERFAALNKELGLQQKITDERERLNKAIEAGQKAGLIDRDQAQQLRDDFEAAAKAAEIIRKGEEELKRLQTERSDIEGELGRTTASPTLGAAERGTAEAQKIIDAAFRQGLQQSEQKPILDKLEGVITAIRDQTDEIKQAEKVEPTTAFEF